MIISLFKNLNEKAYYYPAKWGKEKGKTLILSKVPEIEKSMEK